jgi:lipopolysaccharide export system permease protein
MLAMMGLPLLTLALGVLAIPLSVSSVRSGRAVNLIVALLIYLTASNLFTTVKAAVSQGRLEFYLAWWPLPLGLLLLAAAMFWRKSRL